MAIKTTSAYKQSLASSSSHLSEQGKFHITSHKPYAATLRHSGSHHKGGYHHKHSYPSGSRYYTGLELSIHRDATKGLRF